MFPKLRQRETALCILAELAEIRGTALAPGFFELRHSIRADGVARRKKLFSSLLEKVSGNVDRRRHICTVAARNQASVDCWVSATSGLWFSV